MYLDPQNDEELAKMRECLNPESGNVATAVVPFPPTERDDDRNQEHCHDPEPFSRRKRN
jgi:hypothetical protein